MTSTWVTVAEHLHLGKPKQLVILSHSSKTDALQYRDANRSANIKIEVAQMGVDGTGKGLDIRLDE